MTDVVETLSVGLDWLTVTTVQGDASDALLDTARAIVDRMYPPGAIPENWVSMGYAGQSYGQLKAGRRNLDEAILIISGDLCREVSEFITVPHERVTRADFQVTVALKRPNQLLVAELYNEYKNLTESARAGRIQTYISSPTGDTLNIGKRGRNRYLRLYDRSEQSGKLPLGSVWRYEVELRREVAKAGMKLFNEAEDRERWLAAQVFATFEKAGVNPIYNIGQRISAIEVGLKISTADSKIAWLARCVAPVVTQLINLGYEAEVIEAMKLRGIYR